MKQTNAIALRISRILTAVILVFVLSDFVHRSDGQISLFSAFYSQMQLFSTQSDR